MDVNDNAPKITFSSRPYANMVCRDLDRIFNDTEFLEANEVDLAAVNLSIDGTDGKEGSYFYTLQQQVRQLHNWYAKW